LLPSRRSHHEQPRRIREGGAAVDGGEFRCSAGACDCHTHIHADPEKFPFFAGRVYTPELASPEEMTALHKALHIERVVIVTQASTARTIPRRCSA